MTIVDAPESAGRDRPRRAGVCDLSGPGSSRASTLVRRRVGSLLEQAFDSVSRAEAASGLDDRPSERRGHAPADPAGGYRPLLRLSSIAATSLTTPLAVAEARAACPEATIILGHMGGYFHVDEAIEVAERQNLVLETSAMPYPAKIREAVDRLGPERVIYAATVCSPGSRSRR